jgi:hypothetical protein
MNQSIEDEKLYSLIDSSVDVLERLLKNIVAMRGKDPPTSPIPEYKRSEDFNTVLDEVKGTITFPPEAAQFKISPSSVRLEENVVNQLRDYVSVIAYMYKNHHYHSFEHAQFVIESADRLLARAVVPEKIEYIGMTEEDKLGAKNMQEYTNKIRSDPLTQFAIVFSGLIYALEHPGVPNKQTAKENTYLAILYRNCITEQNSVEVAWDLFQEPAYEDLRGCIYRTQEELDRFRQLVVNSVFATDIFDQEMRRDRNKRWKRAFALENSSSSFQFSLSSLDSADDMDLKATVAMEHIVQAATWAHTMQQFNVFVIWNELYFHERYSAYKAGRSDEDPTLSWYFNQLVFFDSYMIPLATRIAECGLFGITGEEYYRNAKRNRQEWKMKGEELVKTFRSSYKKKD